MTASGTAARAGARWDVVATVDEPAALVCAFVAHHLAAGAGRVFVFLDRFDPDLAARLAGEPRIRAVTCDDAYWAAHARRARPPRHTARQKENADIAYRESRADWLLHCDADEFLRPATGLEDELAGAPEALDWLRVPNLERVHMLGEEAGAQAQAHVFAGAFRAPLADWAGQGERIHGPWAAHLNKGLSGHVAGKGLVRTGRALRMGVHFPRFEGGGAGEPPHADLARARLLHFDGLTPLHFILKLLRRAHEPVYKVPRPHGAFRIRQFTEAREAAGDPDRLAALARGVQALTSAQAAALRGLGALEEAPFDPRGAVAARWPGLEAALAPGAFDAALRTREAALAARAGLAL